MTDPRSVDYAASQLLYSHFMLPAVRFAIDALALPGGSFGLDAGCGPGAFFPVLSEAVGESGQIIGLDLSDAHREHARRQIELHHFQQCVSLIEADLREALPFAENAFDWIWSANVVWPSSFANPAAVVKELARVVKPGGILALFFTDWLRGKLLPGYATLERLHSNAAEMRYTGESVIAPHLQPEQAAGWLREAGVRGVQIRTYLAQYQAPLSPRVASALHACFVEEFLTPPEISRYVRAAGTGEAAWEIWLRLSDPSSPEYILKQEDYHCFWPGTLTWGRKGQTRDE